MNITYMVMTPVQNTLKRGQENGDATKVAVSAEIGTVDGQVPTIETEVKPYEVSMDGYRIVNGKEMKSNNINSNRRGMQLAIINEQKEKKAQNSQLENFDMEI